MIPFLQSINKFDIIKTCDYVHEWYEPPNRTTFYLIFNIIVVILRNLASFKRSNFLIGLGIVLSTIESFSSELRKVRNEWLELDPAVRRLDLLSLLSILVFGIGYIVVRAFDLTLTVTNGAMLISPIILAGYMFIYRSKLADKDSDHVQARKEFRNFLLMTLGLILLTLVYSIFLSTVL